MDMLPPSCCGTVINVTRNGSKGRYGVINSIFNVDGKEARERSTQRARSVESAVKCQATNATNKLASQSAVSQLPPCMLEFCKTSSYWTGGRSESLLFPIWKHIMSEFNNPHIRLTGPYIITTASYFISSGTTLLPVTNS